MGDFAVHIEQCWGCNRLRIPKPWTPKTLPLLRAEGRLRVGEYLCTFDDCQVNEIVTPVERRGGGR